MTNAEIATMIASGASLFGVIATASTFVFKYGIIHNKVESIQAELKETKDDFKVIHTKLFEKLDKMVEHMADIKTNTEMTNIKLDGKVDKVDCRGCK